MSTFDGKIREFPGVRVDFFRAIAKEPPLACFLSHIHSDHLAGLDTYRGRPVYCSAATRAFLLKLQRYSSRINFPKGLIEKQEITYKHQKGRLKPLPLQTPTEVELEPGNVIRVTLFDANHCPGAVMFLFERNGKAVLYTGDVRSEPWHVNTLARSPCMFEYSSGLKVLDRIYLDTTHTEDVTFPTKAEGLRELIEKVQKYPKDTVFYFSAHTYGYEDVWIALAKALDTRIHVDNYKLQAYESLHIRMKDDEDYYLSPEAPALVGFKCGNRFQAGLLTDKQTVRLHSCEKGSRCLTMQRDNVVFITPIIAHLSRTEDMAEHGIGGGCGDLEHNKEPIVSADAARNLSQRKELSSELNGDKMNSQSALVSFTKAPDAFRTKHTSPVLPDSIKFPYSRHSSYREACHLLGVFKPKDIWPCSVNPVRWIKEGISIQGLFGDYCTGDVFEHDVYMKELALEMNLNAANLHSSQHSDAWGNIQESTAEQSEPKNFTPVRARSNHLSPALGARSLSLVPFEEPQQATASVARDSSQGTMCHIRSPELSKRAYGEFADGTSAHIGGEGISEDASYLLKSQATLVSAFEGESRRVAFESILGTSGHGGWAGLLSTTNNHTHPERELGEF
ncbi:beta-lactamase-like protein [Coniella lustricola]|uniref:Beta-lactamase-like protein n=1 Tax=Coniella lustricola TaxID=2025994 RepID=A0A2T3AGT6_9PEZI|nr:beta-lactamase-like protein [Coniella lustricola]